MNEHQAKIFADRAAGTASEAVEIGVTSAESAGKGVQQGYFAVVEGVRDFNVRLLDMIQTNTLAALDMFRQLSLAKDRRKLRRFGRRVRSNSSKR
jgi:hypothetical protein